MALILLVEDNADMQSLLRDLLEWEGHQVVCGRSGQEALAELEALPYPPDVIISDLTMPYMDGLSLLREVRADARWSGVPFVMMSANPYDDRLNTAEAGLLNGMLPKPFSVEEINHLLNW